MADLWQETRDRARKGVRPLALRMRPRTLDEFFGQSHLLGPGRLLRRMLDADAFTSIIFHGPPGTGKTTLAELIASHTKRHFERENAASVGVKRVRDIIDEAVKRLEYEGRRTILFLDEIHRFTRAQQDVLLGDVERGLITLIGATTENPVFAVNSALVSRSTLFRLEALSVEEISGVIRRAIVDAERGYGSLDLRVDDDAIHVWATKCDGDARRALTALEVAVLSSQTMASSTTPGASRHGTDLRAAGRDPHLDTRRAGGEPSPEEVAGLARGARTQGASTTIVIDRAIAEDSIQQKAAVYDHTGDEHYDAISAMIKSVRGGDPDAAVYWIARMLEAGEDPRFIARRLAILASEDIGNADPRGIMVATAAWEMTERVGMPECRITLAQCAIYLACAPKSNASYVAIDEAIADIREGRTIPVPIHLRDSHAPPAADGRAHGTGYEYSHDSENAISGQDYLGVEKAYFRPTDRGHERAMAQHLEALRKAREARP